MRQLPKLLWITITVLTLNDSVASICIITKDVSRSINDEIYTDCSRGYCQTRRRHPEIGPIEYSCSNTSIGEINNYSQRKPNIENKLFIKDSDISSLRPNTYYWPNLTELHMENTNTLEIVPGFFSKFDTLTVLKITNNKLQTIIDGVFGSLTTLTSLNLSKNSIVGLTAHSFSGLLHLKFLDLSKNKIASISPQVFEYQNFLINVDFSENLINDVSNIFNKTSLETIQLSNNQLTHFDFEQLKHNSDLIRVDLSKNKINSIKNVANIKYVYISYNNLEVIDDDMLNSNVKILDLSNNDISTISEKSFENATDLEYLYLEHNNIKSMPRESLQELKNLKGLDLSFNSITNIPLGLFNNLDKLVYLNLSDNNMLLDFHALTTLKSLEILEIQNNKMTNFDVNLLATRFTHLSYVSLGDNLWTCHELANTIHLLQTNNVSISPGNNTKTDNILGISCKNHGNFKEDSIIFIKNNQSVSQDSRKNTELIVNRAYDDDFQNNTIKYLENITRQLSSQNITNISKDIDQNNFIQYLNKNFTTTTFYKYVESLKQFESNRSNMLSQMMNFFQDGFNRTNFYKQLNSFKLYPINNVSSNDAAPPTAQALNQTVKLLHSFNKTLLNISGNLKVLLSSLLNKNAFLSNPKSNDTEESVDLDRRFESQALIDSHAKADEGFKDNLIFTNVLLVLILCCIMTHLYYTFWKTKFAKGNIQEQVQLM